MQMKRFSILRFLPTGLFALALCATDIEAADSVVVTVQADQPGLKVPPTLHGLFFEDINYGADGGLYAELVQNRSFEHRDALYSWSEIARDGAKGSLTVASEAPLNANN